MLIPEHNIDLTNGQKLLLFTLSEKNSDLPLSIRSLCGECVDKGLIVYFEVSNSARLTHYGEIVRKALVGIKDEPNENEKS